VRPETRLWKPSKTTPLLSLLLLLLLGIRVEAQTVQVDGVSLDGTQSNLNVTVDIIEYRQGEDPVVHLTPGKHHYGVAIVSQSPIAMFDAELSPPTATQHQFTVTVEDGREFSRCLVAGLKSAGSDPSHQLSYSLVCETVTPPPTLCRSCM